MRTFLQALLIACSLLTRSAFAQMSGTYTVGPAGADYATIQEAWDDLEASSINGPVELVVSPGTYAQQLVLGAVSGVSATNTITLRPLNLGAYDVLITHGVTYAADYPVRVYCDHVQLKDLHFSATRPAGVVGRWYSSVVHVEADDLLMERCNVDIVGDALGIALRVIGERARIESCRMEHLSATPGYSDFSGISVIGASPEILDNQIVHFCHGLSVANCTTAVVADNRIDGVKEVNDAHINYGNGIGVSGLLEGTIARNRIISYGPTNAIHVGLLSSSSGFDVGIKNNMISIFEKETAPPVYGNTAIGIYYIDETLPTHSERINAPIVGDLRIKHNSIYAEHDDLSGIYIRNKVDAGAVIRSNSIRVIGNNCKGLNYVGNTVAPWPISDYNNVSLFGVGNWYGQFQTLAQVVANTTMEDNSITSVPHYFSKTNLHIKENSPNINRAFTDLLLDLDYDKDPRQHFDVGYDIGADEYGNLGLKSIVVAPTALPAAATVIGAYPNPAKDQLVFELPDDRPQPFTLHATDGRLVFQGTAFPEQAVVLHGLANGSYIARFPGLPGTSTRVVIAH
jgi:hypothetical protein